MSGKGSCGTDVQGDVGGVLFEVRYVCGGGWGAPAGVVGDDHVVNQGHMDLIMTKGGLMIYTFGMILHSIWKCVNAIIPSVVIQCLRGLDKKT